MKLKLFLIIIAFILINPGYSFSQDNTKAKHYEIEIVKAPLSYVVQLFAKVLDRNLVVPSDLDIEVSASFSGIEAEEALKAILNTYDLTIKNNGDLLEIGKKPVTINPTNLLSTKTIRLKYANGSEVVEQVKSLQSKQGKVVFDQRTNSVTFKDKAYYLKMITHFISKIDRPEKQIQIEAQFLEVSVDYLRQRKISWQKSLGIDQENQFAIGKLRDLSVDLALSNHWASLLSKPSVIIKNRKTATLKSGIEFYLPTNGKDLESLNLGIELVFTPQISSQDRILLAMEIRESEPVFKKKISEHPYSITNYAKTEIEFVDGESAVIGGLFQLPKENGKKKLANRRRPLLNGYYRSKEKDLRELLIIITPKIIP